MADGAGVLEWWAPRLVYDSRERSFACSVDGEPDVIYGRVVGDWLQYWMFFETDWSPVPWRRGHPFDWEGVQWRLEGAAPDVAVLAQHAAGEVTLFSDLEFSGSHPHVYVELGRHASRPGRVRNPLRPADGRGRVVVPAVAVPPVDGWRGRGRWGGHPRAPLAPGLQRRWRDPDGWAARVATGS